MAKVKQYEMKNGEKAYWFKYYAGTDPFTKKKQYVTRRGFKTEKEAKLALAKIQLDVEDKGYKKLETNLFEDVYKLWFEQHQNSVREITASRTADLFRLHILPKFGNIPVTKITTLFCQRSLNDWHSYYSKFKTLKSYTQQVLDFAIAMDLISNNPMKNTLMPKKKQVVEDDKLENFYTLDILKQFLEVVEEQETFKHFAMFRLHAFSGLRKGELMALTWNDINFEEKYLNVTKSLTYINKKPKITPPKNKGSKRVVPLDDTTLSILRNWKLQQITDLFKLGINIKSKKQQLIFTRITKNDSNYPLHMDYLNNVLNRVIDKNNLPKISPHGFRHTHASLLFESGANVKDVQERLGHASIQITLDIYTHVTKKSKKNTAEKFAKYANF